MVKKNEKRFLTKREHKKIAKLIKAGEAKRAEKEALLAKWGEVWVQVPGHDENYFISSESNLENKRGHGIADKYSDTKNKKESYIKKQMYENGKPKYRRLNKLMNTAFMGIPYDDSSSKGMNDDHLKGIHDNRLVSLERVTAAENQRRRNASIKAKKASKKAA